MSNIESAISNERPPLRTVHCRVRAPAVHSAASILLMGLSMTPGQPARAQETQDAGQSEALQQVLVTASKREESIQNVPISVSAFSGEQLEKQQIRSAADLAGVVPNLSVNLPVGDAQPVYSIRGINTADFALGQNSPVALYYDEVYKGTSPVQGVGLFDLARVEVLKGPQGTLYGKNTTGGAINFITRVPDFTTKANVNLGYGNYNAIHAEGGAQTAVTDTLAVRLAFTLDQADGWLKNLARGEPNTASTDDYGARATFLFKPSDRLNITVRGAVSELNPFVSGGAWVQLVPEGVGFPSYPAQGAGGVLLEPEQHPDPRVAYTLSPHHNLTKTRSLSATATLQLTDDLSLISITAWDHGEQRRPFDGYTQIKILKNSFFAKSTQTAQDLRLTSSYSGPFNFILGAYYSREKIYGDSLTAFLFDIDVNGDGVVDAADCVAGGFFAACTRGNSFDQLKKSAALYSDASYQLTEKIKLRAGLRYTKDDGDLTNGNAFNGDIDGNPIVFTFTNQTRHFSDDNLSGRVGLDYKMTDDVMLYTSYSRGYRGAAFNNLAYANAAELNVADPEEITAYEAGFKTELLAHRIRFNGALFYMDYKNQQVLSFDPVTQANNLVSLGTSRVKGGELELQFQASDGLRLFASTGILDSEIVRGAVSGVDVSGGRLVGAPRATASGGFDWEGPLGARWRYGFHVDGNYTSKQFYNLNNNPLEVAGGYSLWNSRLRFSNTEDTRGLAFWVKNLTDKTYYATVSDALGFVGANFVSLNAPRMYGVSFDAKFD